MAITLDGTDGVTTTGLTSNGIDDNATSTAITINSSQNVGIGTASPAAGVRLAVVGGELVQSGSATGDAGVKITGVGTSYAEIDAFAQFVGWGMPLILQRQGGEVWIGGTTDRGSYNLQVNGTGVWGQGSYVNGSDSRWKDNVQTLDCNCLDIVNGLRSVSYTYNEDSGASDLTTIHLGFIAQEVEQATGNHPWLSGLVTEDPQGYKSMAYQELIPVLTKAIQEQQAMIETLQAEVEALKNV